MPGKGTLFAAKFGNSRVSSTDKSLAYSMFFMNWAWFTSHALWRFSPNSTQTLFCTPRTQSTRIASTKLARMHAHIRAIHRCTLCFVASKHQNYPFAPLIGNSTIFHHSFSPSSSTMSEDDCLTIWNSLSTLFRSSAISLSPSGAVLCRSMIVDFHFIPRVNFEMTPGNLLSISKPWSKVRMRNVTSALLFQLEPPTKKSADSTCWPSTSGSIWASYHILEFPHCRIILYTREKSNQSVRSRFNKEWSFLNLVFTVQYSPVQG